MLLSHAQAYHYSERRRSVTMPANLLAGKRHMRQSIHFTRHFARRSLILKLVIHHYNIRFILSLSAQVRQRVA